MNDLIRLTLHLHPSADAPIIMASGCVPSAIFAAEMPKYIAMLRTARAGRFLCTAGREDAPDRIDCIIDLHVTRPGVVSARVGPAFASHPVAHLFAEFVPAEALAK